MVEIRNAEHLQEVLSANTLVAVDFWAPWCSPCKLMTPRLEKVSVDFPEMSFVKVNCDDLREVAKGYGVRGLPTILLFSNGQVTGTSIVGLTEETDIKERVHEWFNAHTIPTGGDSVPNLLKHLDGYINHDEHEQLMDRLTSDQT